jgi:hypothetical protein
MNEPTAWTILGIVYIICAIVTVIICLIEKK